MAIPIFVGLALWLPHRRARSEELRAHFWYWHTPFQIAPEQLSSLRGLNIDTLFVRAATISNSLDGYIPTLPQTWKPAPKGLSVHLVLPFDAGAVRHLEDTSDADIAKVIVRTFSAHRRLAEASGIKVVGLQLDLDCPTRLLPKYARLLKILRGSGALMGQKLSITALPTWLTSATIEKVLEPLDFYAPQFYEGEMPKTLEDFRPVASPSGLSRGIARAERLGRPYVIGLPAYGHALLFDESGRLAGTLRGLSPSQAARHPSLQWVSSEPLAESGKASTAGAWIGEDLAVFRAANPGEGSQGSGSRAAFDMPSAEQVGRLVAQIGREAGGHCAGYALFRFPEQGEELSVPMSAIDAALKGSTPGPKVEGSLIVETSPWSAVEAPGREIMADLTLKLTNRGDAPTRFGPRAVEATLYFSIPGLESVDPGQAETAVSLSAPLSKAAPLGDPVPSGLARANSVRFRLSLLGPGKRAAFGPVRVPVKPGARVWAVWRVEKAGGFETVEGKIEPKALQNRAKK
jgi:hypothetical protein